MLDVPQHCLWGAQTQRSLEHFSISTETLPKEFIHALARVKRAAAIVNRNDGRLSSELANAIIQAAAEVEAGQHDSEFPLSVWQTGSGTQTNMNMNEVLANRASELLGGERGMKRKLHPNDHCNLGQSSNDVFPTALHVVIALATKNQLLPSLRRVILAIDQKANQYAALIKIGRTHLQDAMPMTLGQEFSGYVAQLQLAATAIQSAQANLYALAIGGTAVGTGFGTPEDFGCKVAQILTSELGLPFISAENKFAALAGHEAITISHAALKTLACTLIKIANDVRWLASGPRCGLGELMLPENEPGSSMMPGKVNPTQCEALIMLSLQVLANDVVISSAAAAGNFELNVTKPLTAHAYLQSIRLLSDGISSFTRYCITGMVANERRMTELVESSLMLVTALVPHIGYDKAAAIAKTAHAENQSLREAALASGYVSAFQFDRWIQPVSMTHPS
ncbi:MAG: class II fumarate hydratase [Polynucleobacter sp.]|nr:class II fumarate hydratase [Polynucleobacter sp.]